MVGAAKRGVLGARIYYVMAKFSIARGLRGFYIQHHKFALSLCTPQNRIDKIDMGTADKLAVVTSAYMNSLRSNTDYSCISKQVKDMLP